MTDYTHCLCALNLSYNSPTDGHWLFAVLTVAWYIGDAYIFELVFSFSSGKAKVEWLDHIVALFSVL